MVLDMLLLLRGRNGTNIYYTDWYTEMCRYWLLGGNHNHAARVEICNEHFGGDWNAVRRSSHFKELATTKCSICIGLTPIEAKEVTLIPWLNILLYAINSFAFTLKTPNLSGCALGQRESHLPRRVRREVLPRAWQDRGWATHRERHVSAVEQSEI